MPGNAWVKVSLDRRHRKRQSKKGTFPRVLLFYGCFRDFSAFSAAAATM